MKPPGTSTTSTSATIAHTQPPTKPTEPTKSTNPTKPAHHQGPGAGPTKRPSRPAEASPEVGALGVKAAWEACDLLTRAQIARQFGGPVGPGVPTYPYCSWTVGKNAFVALDMERETTFGRATRFVAKLESVPGVGTAAIIGNNRYLYFSERRTSYWLLWQQAGDFSTLNTAQLSHLAEDVLAAAQSGAASPPPAERPAPLGVYFAGDSTAAGPEWAWATYFAPKAGSTLTEYQVGSGLIVPQYFNWAAHLRAVALARRPKLVVYMGSGNDGQAFYYKGVLRQPGSPGWNAAYGALVASMIRGVVSTGARLLLVGEPAMESPSLSAAMADLDAIEAAEANRFKGAYFFNPGTVLNGPQGQYEAKIAIDGKLTTIRLDGIHLNYYGSLYLGRYLGKLIDQLLPTGGR